MAENPAGKVAIPALATTAYTAKQPKKRKSDLSKRESKRESDNKRNKTRVNIGQAFERWRELRDRIGLKLDSELAVLLMDTYERGPSTLTPKEEKPFDVTAPAVSSIGASSGMDSLCDKSIVEEDMGEDFHIQGVGLGVLVHNKSINIHGADEGSPYPHQKDDGEMDDSSEVTDNSSDDEYLPAVRISLGGALKEEPPTDGFPIDKTVHDQPAQRAAPDEPTSCRQAPLFQDPQYVLCEDDIIGARASIVYDDCLRQLATFLVLPLDKCPCLLKNGVDCDCVAPFDVNVTSKGTATIVEWTCPNGHSLWRWNSQPVMKYGMQAGDFMLSTNILLSGNNYTNVALLFKFMNLGMVNKNTFFSIQNTYCINTVKDFWEERRAEALRSLPGKDVVDQDDRNEEEEEEDEEDFTETEDEPTSRADADAQIAAFIDPDKGRYKALGLHHSLDIWHGAKNLAKKIEAAAKVKGQSILLSWMKDIVNHFWWCCETADTAEQFLALWVGIIHHVCNIHTWSMGSCQHGHLEETHGKEWIQRDSKCHKALVDIVLDKRWQKDVHKYLRSRSDPEVSQNHLYAGKRSSFSPPVYEARVQLAALDYNFHRNRPTMKSAEGKEIYRRTYKKNAKRHSVCALKSEKTYDYIAELQARIVKRRITSQVGMPRRRSLRPDDSTSHT